MQSKGLHLVWKNHERVLQFCLELDPAIPETGP
jgi:hypothetical protein